MTTTWISNRMDQFAYFDQQLGHPDWSAATVLDFGGNCGNILLGSDCTIDPNRYWCVDLSRDAVELGRQRHPLGHFIWYDRYNFEYNPQGIRELPLPDLGQRFDIILAWSVFTHTSRAEMRNLVAKLRSLLTEDGVLAFTFIDPLFEPPEQWAREDEAPGLDNLAWRLAATQRFNSHALTVAEQARRSELSWSTLVNNEELVLDPTDEWIQQGEERSQYITFCTAEHMRSIYPDARMLPPVRPERHSCCVLRKPAEPIVVVRPVLPVWEKLSPALRGVVDSQVLTNDGPRVRRLESLLSTEFGVSDVAVTGSGTTAIQLACSALGLTGEVIVPAAAFPAISQAVLRAGATPVPVDIEDTYLTIDPDAVRAAITPDTCAILPVHTFGCPADVDALQSIADSAGLPLIFDAATCYGVTYRGRPLLSFGDVATLSLHATKLTHSVEGGAVLGNTRAVADTVRRLRNFGTGSTGALPAGTNARMSELHAAVGAVVLAEAPAEIARRQAVRTLYLDALTGLDWLRPLALRPEAGPAVAAMPVRLSADAPCDAEGLCSSLLGAGVHARAYFAGRYRVSGLDTTWPAPRAEQAAQRIVCLPFHGGLTERHIARIRDALRAITRSG
jgi:dTDP-4-amino-4,6-dideoxygalactose transaminase/SAM-dependent methyltransferase